MRTAVHTRRIVDPIFGAQADRHGRQDHVRRAECASTISPSDVGDRGDAVRRSQQAVHDRPRHVRAAAIGLRRRHLHAHAARRAATTSSPAATCRCGRRRRSRCPATFLTSRTQRRATSDTSGNAAQATYSYETRAVPASARPSTTTRLPDGHGVLQPHRLHRRVVVQRGELLSASGQNSGCSASTRSYFAKVGQRSHPGRRRGLPPHRHPLQRHAPGLLRTSRTPAATKPWQGTAVTRSATTSSSSAACRSLRWLNAVRRRRQRPGDLLRR